MRSYLGIAIGPRWQVALVSEAVRGSAADQSHCGKILVDSGQDQRDGLSVLDGLGVGLSVESLTEEVYLVPDARSGLQVLPSDNVSHDRSIRHVSWNDVIRQKLDERLLSELVTEYLMTVVARVEERTGARIVPDVRLSICVNGWGSVGFYRALANAATQLFGTTPVFLWSPTACAAWGVIPGVPVRDTGNHPRTIQVQGRRTTALVYLRPVDSGLVASVCSPADSGADDSTAQVNVPDADLDWAGAGGAALWRLWTERTGRGICERSRLTFIVGGPRWDDEREHELALYPVQAEQDTAPCRCFARALQSRGLPSSPFDLCIWAHAPWLEHAVLVHTRVFSREEAVTNWHLCFSVVVEWDPEAYAGRVSFIRPNTLGAADSQFQLLPTVADRADDPPASVPADQVQKSLLGLAKPGLPFRNGERFDGEDGQELKADPVTGSVYRLAEGIRVVPAGLDPPYLLHFLRFGRRYPRLTATLEGQRLKTCSVRVGPTRSNLWLDTFELSVPRCEVRSETQTVHCRMESRRVSRSKAKKQGRPEGPDPFAIAFVILPPVYGLKVQFRWQADDADVLCPVPVGRVERGRVSGHRQPVAGIVLAREGDAPIVTTVGRGQLLLANRGPYPLRIRFQPAGGIRLWTEQEVLASGQQRKIRVARRRTVQLGSCHDFDPLHIDCEVEPLGEVARQGPPASLRVRDEQPAAAEIQVLPPEEPVRWKLRSRMPEHAWRLPIRLSRPQRTAVIVRPVGQGEEYRAQAIPRDRRSSQQYWKADVELSFEPAALLGWFPGPLEEIRGELEVIQDRGEPRLPSVRVPFVADLRGLFCVQRSLQIQGKAGLRLAVRLDFLLSEDTPTDFTVHLQWDSSAPPYPLDASLCSDRNSCDPEAQCLCVCGESLSNGLVQANSHHKVSRYLVLQPRGACGWEEGSWSGTLIFQSQAAEIYDQIRCVYSIEAYKPVVGAALERSDAPEPSLRASLTIRNTNPFAALEVRQITLTAKLRRLRIPVVTGRLVLVCSGQHKLRIEPGESRSLTGCLELRARWFRGYRLAIARRAWIALSIERTTARPSDGTPGWRWTRDLHLGPGGKSRPRGQGGGV